MTPPVTFAALIKRLRSWQTPDGHAAADLIEPLVQRVLELRDQWKNLAHDSTRRPGKWAVYGRCASELTALLGDIEGSTGAAKDGDAK